MAVLPKMSCPHLIEPHQIQGLDFINIFPVIQWLVKRSVENRAERAEKLKSFAVGQFHNHFKLQVDKVAKEKNTKVLENIEKIQNLYAPRREFKKKASAGSSEDELTRVRITLLEFGDKGRLLATNRQKSTEKNLSTEEMEEKASEVDEVSVHFYFLECLLWLYFMFLPSRAMLSIYFLIYLCKTFRYLIYFFLPFVRLL